VPELTLGIPTQGLRPERTRAAIDSALAQTAPGDVLVDHNYGGTDAMQVIGPGGVPVANATIAAYRTADYDAGLRDASKIRGATPPAPTADGSPRSCSPPGRTPW